MGAEVPRPGYFSLNVPPVGMSGNEVVIERNITFGRLLPGMSWERIDRAEALAAAVRG